MAIIKLLHQLWCKAFHGCVGHAIAFLCGIHVSILALLLIQYNLNVSNSVRTSSRLQKLIRATLFSTEVQGQLRMISRWLFRQVRFILLASIYIYVCMYTFCIFATYILKSNSQDLRVYHQRVVVAFRAFLPEYTELLYPFNACMLYANQPLCYS